MGSDDFNSRLLGAWRDLAPNFDRTVGVDAPREFMKELSRNRFQDSTWREAFTVRREEFQEFFHTYDYGWVTDQANYDFPIETSLQIRTLDAAIALFYSKLPDKPERFHFDSIVARSTFLPKLHEVTPHVQKTDGFQFVITPLGWLEYLQRYFAAFDFPDKNEDAKTRPVREDAFNRILVSLIASHATQLDYAVPQMIDAIVQRVQFFEVSATDFSVSNTTNRANDLAYAAQDFALCHEVAHIAAQDFASPDEARADRWGLVAYYGSWGQRLALHLELGQHDPTRAAMGPIAFSCILRSLLSARVLVAQKLGSVVSDSLKSPSRFSIVAQRSREIVLATLEHRALFVSDLSEPEEKQTFARLSATLNSLLEFEVAFSEFISSAPEDACRQAYSVALEIEQGLRQENEATINTKMTST